jgi:hypothetical protein
MIAIEDDKLSRVPLVDADAFLLIKGIAGC